MTCHVITWYNNGTNQKKERTIIKKTIDLLREVITLGFDKEDALREIDASLDEKLGGDRNRKPLMEEVISDELYEDILFGFQCEAE